MARDESLVALYGTLKVGYFNYELHLKSLLPIDSRRLELPYEMYENGEYPMLVPSAERHSIWVELFEVDAVKLRELDELESPYGYWRETVFLHELSREAEIYVHAAPPPSGFTRVASGRWPRLR